MHPRMIILTSKKGILAFSPRIPFSKNKLQLINLKPLT